MQKQKEIIKNYLEEDQIDDYKSSDLTYDGDFDSKQYTWTIATLVSMIEKKELVLPKYQRAFKWSASQASLFIDSLINELPTPAIFVYKSNESFKVVDGQQRLNTIYSFAKELPLPGKTVKFKLAKNVRSDLKQKSYNSLTKEEEFKLNYANINVIEFLNRDDRPNRMLLNLFKRLNSGGTHLSNQEIRNALYISEFYEKLQNSANKNVWKEYFKEKEQKNEKHIEVALRCLLVYHFYLYNKKIQNPKIKLGNLQREYDNFSEAVINYANNQNIDETWYKKIFSIEYEQNTLINNLINIFEKTIKIIKENYGEEAFRGSTRESDPEKRQLANARRDNITEALFTYCALAQNKLITPEEREKIVLTDDFIATFASSTNTENINYRIDSFLNNDKY